MYLPENDAQLYDILSELRVYAQTNALPGLAEELDDALVLLASEMRRNERRKAEAARAEDGR
ncbi:hypothetical protein [Amaricoccus sp.]|uniref:hypothetical protein n=1 Tax=Amaricoccus sp. TaxID=1872485 RepID=UPI001B760E1E|nr:hypothetical protein [Amaricoccus sp.]MBP7000268.1 hypothetical protein [Amaricoccus sp.]